MTNDNRIDQGQPTGGQFAAKSYTEADVDLLSSAMTEADQAAVALQQKSLLLRAQYVATSVLVAYPNAATITLVESDQEDCTWSDEYILDADGNHIAESIDLDLTADFWEMPSRASRIDKVQPDGSSAHVDDPKFAWLKITHDRRRGSTAIFDVRAAATIGDTNDQETSK